MPLEHEFWLLREKENNYRDYHKFLSRQDAPIKLHDDLLRYFTDTLLWVPTLNPAKAGLPKGYGLNWYGPTIINQSGGALLHQICTSWAQLFKCGPVRLKLQGGFSLQWPFEESEHLVREEQLATFGHSTYLTVERDWLVQTLTTLAFFGERSATGEFFLLHLGI